MIEKEIEIVLQDLNKFIKSNDVNPLFHIDPEFSIVEFVIYNDNKFVTKVFNSKNKPMLFRVKVCNREGVSKDDFFI